MVQGKRILVNTLLLTLTSLLMRAIGMSFQVYLTSKIGAAGVGLFQLIMSVYTLFTTFAISGIRFATTRLVSEELGISPDGKISKIVRRCLLYALFFGTAATVILLLTADSIGLLWIKDSRSVLSLKVLSTSLPFLSMSAVLSGYFTAVSRVIKSALSQLLEQLTRIGVVLAVYTLYGSDNLENACAVIMAGGALGDLVSFSLQYVLYLFDRRVYDKPRILNRITVRMASIALPLALSTYARTALSTLQQLLVPAGFKKYGSSSEKALADYGIVHGMVIPIITFPSALFYALGDVLVPELTSAQVREHYSRITYIVNRILRLSILISIGLSVMLFYFADEIGMLFYNIEDVGRYIRILSFVMPVMYLDSITDGMLRGLGQHMYTMWVNITDSVVSVFLVYLLLPKWAVAGYLFMIGFTEIINFGLSIYRLSKYASLRFDCFAILRSFAAAAGAVNIAILILRSLGLACAPTAFSVSLHLTLSLLLYLALLLIFKCINRSDLDMLWGFFGKSGLKQH